MRYLSANQFDVFEEIGKGGFGVVYRGIDKVTKQQVAIKQIDLESTDNIDDLQREIKILSLCRLEQITRYEGCFVKGHKLWIIMEYLDGGSCMDLLAPGPIKEKHIAILLRELLHALSYLHENSRIHRDIKAANILLSKNGEVKIADFGVSTQLSNNLSRRNTFVGSPYWMSPEVIMEEEYNFKADIWSLGITAIELATGKPPLSHIPPMKVLFQIPENKPPRLEGPQFSDDFKQFVEMCLQMNPNSRPSAKRLLKSRFISWAGKKSSLVELITRREQWELKHGAEMTKKKRHYVPTIMDDMVKDKENNITFDFGDNEADTPSSSPRDGGNVSEVIITKKSPLKYSARDLEYSPLNESQNILNLQDSPKLSTLTIPKSKRSSPKKSSTPPLSKSDIIEGFQSALKSVNCNDDVQLVKLEHIHMLLQELDDSVVVKFHEQFSEKLENRRQELSQPSPPQSYKQTELMKPLGPRVYANTMINHKPKSSGSQDSEGVRPRMGPRKAESEKLLLKRWADQYFT